jgi:hypothetical protein
MTQPRASTSRMIVCKQLVTRFDRNGEREIGLPLLRRVRSNIRRDMRSAGAHGSMVWRLARTPSGITVTALWHPRRDEMIALASPERTQRQEVRLDAARSGIVNRRRIGRLTVPHAVMAVGAAVASAAA